MKIAVVRCSDIRKQKEQAEIDSLCGFLSENGAKVIRGNYLYENVSSSLLAAELMRCYKCKPDMIFDISGGDSSEQLLPYMDFELISSSDAVFYGYSDLTVILNAIYAKTGKASVLWQARNIIRDKGGRAKDMFLEALGGGRELFSPDIKLLRGNVPAGTVVGGNLRCFLKLAGTEYFPDTSDKVIVAEAMSGNAEKICGSFDRLLETGALLNARGLILGTFTEAGRLGEQNSIIEYILSKTDLPVAVTEEIGHAPTSKALLIGGKFRI